MRMLVNLLLTWLWVMYETYPSEAQNEVPEQEECKIHQAMVFDPALIPKLPKEWFVARATLRTVLPEGVPEPTINSCSPMSYLQTCQGAMYVENNWDADGGLVKITKAFSEQYDDVVEYWESLDRKDSNYFIYGGFGTSMTLHFRNGKWKNIPTYDFPEMVVYAQSRWYAITYYGFFQKTGEVEWVLYQSCDEDFAWVEIAQWVIKANKLNDINASIDEILSTNLLTIPHMVKLLPELPFRA